MRSWFADAWARYVPEDKDGDDPEPDPDLTASEKRDRSDRSDRIHKNPHKQADSDLSDNLSDRSGLSDRGINRIGENPHEQRTLSHLSDLSDNPGVQHADEDLSHLHPRAKLRPDGSCVHDFEYGRGCFVCDLTHPYRRRLEEKKERR